MYAPRAQEGFHVPHSLKPIGLAFVAICVTVAVWAGLSARTTSNEAGFFTGSALPDPATVRSVAYIVPRSSFDAVYLRAVDSSAPPRFIASFPVILDLHIRGSVSPMADRAVLLRADSIEGASARLTMMMLPSGDVSEADASVDYSSHLAWAPDGSTLAAVSTARLESGKPLSSVIEYHTGSGSVTSVAHFEGALQVAPVGYSFDGSRLYVVVVDQSGSALWVVANEAQERLTLFSPGPTSQWSLSPDGARLAFVARIGAGERTYAGKVLVIATSSVTDIPARADQIGAAWRPGALLPDFGGPGGSLQLTDPRSDGYVIPMRWSPDGRSLVAAVYGPATAGSTASTPSMELVSADRRERLAADEGALFLGWVRNGD